MRFCGVVVVCVLLWLAAGADSQEKTAYDLSLRLKKAQKVALIFKETGELVGARARYSRKVELEGEARDDETVELTVKDCEEKRVPPIVDGRRETGVIEGAKVVLRLDKRGAVVTPGDKSEFAKRFAATADKTGPWHFLPREKMKVAEEWSMKATVPFASEPMKMKMRLVKVEDGIAVIEGSGECSVGEGGEEQKKANASVYKTKVTLKIRLDTKKGWFVESLMEVEARTKDCPARTIYHFEWKSKADDAQKKNSSGDEGKENGSDSREPGSGK